MNWHVSPDQFLSLCAAGGRDEFPFPLRYRSAALWEDEHAANLSAAHEWRRQLEDPRLERAIRILLTGEIAVEVYGRSTDGSADLNARGSAEGDYAVLARQHAAYGDIEITTMSTALLAATLAGHIPAAAPGREAERTASTKELVEPGDGATVRRPIEDSETRALRRLLLRERTATGSIRVLACEDGLRFTPTGDLGWFDVAGDGRYLFVPGSNTRVSPGTIEVLRKELSSQIDKARRRRRTAQQPSAPFR
ncbi:ESX secretion-associated protein EspG [Rhodococcus chondri]|uniref:ESX secretion-associated protein EspG n=1 Tax=Rhodococcus chondri TaxID=3065941 RepID=A0ABU7JWF5_9NOCA|nr:ESX secretion-associated protein EspG [Rhodococcus sp. CC-R104]MEE2033612.1 ESX secretion-associated protein EspG [Rhodococcus sp. CC-R104]